MMRHSKWIASFAFAGLVGLGCPSGVAFAKDEEPDKVTSLSDKQTEELTAAAEAVARGDTAAAQRHTQAAEAYGRAAQQTAQNEGMKAEIERMRAQIERDNARAERDREMYDRPSWLEQVGMQIAQGLIQALLDAGKQKLNEYMNGGNEELLDQIKNLEDERTRLEEELANPGGDNGSIPGLGPIITDPNGTTGYDRDGDGFVDIPTNPDGSIGDNNTGPSTTINPPVNPISGLPGTVAPNSSDDDDLDRDDTAALPTSFGGGGASTGGSGGPNFGGMGGAPGGAAGAAAGGAAEAGAEDGEDDDEDGDEDGDEDSLGGGAKKGTGGGLSSDDDDSSDTDADGNKLEKKSGRVLVLPKLKFEDLAGNHKPNSDWSDEWENDEWNDKADNGDLDSEWAEDDDWGEEWDTAKKKGAAQPKKATTAEDKAAAELVDQIIRVETVVADWRKLETKAKEAGVDPYGFEDSEMGYEATGGEKKDPYKDVRTADGKIDLTKVDVWIIEADTWKDGEEPVRYRLNIDVEEITDFDPIPGGVALVKGAIKDLDVDSRVLEEIKGKVKEITVKTVLLSAAKPPEDLSSLTGDQSEDEDGAEKTDEDMPEPTAPKAEKKGDLDDWEDDEGW